MNRMKLNRLYKASRIVRTIRMTRPFGGGRGRAMLNGSTRAEMERSDDAVKVILESQLGNRKNKMKSTSR